VVREQAKGAGVGIVTIASLLGLISCGEAVYGGFVSITNDEVWFNPSCRLVGWWQTEGNSPGRHYATRESPSADRFKVEFFVLKEGFAEYVTPDNSELIATIDVELRELGERETRSVTFTDRAGGRHHMYIWKAKDCDVDMDIPIEICDLGVDCEAEEQSWNAIP
jgi:hypothetical protein